MVNLNPDLPVKIAKRIAGQCAYSGCHEPAEDGDYCAPHDAHERARDAGKKRRRRRKLAKSGFCIGGCGRKVPRKKGKRQPKRCSTCRREHNAKRQAAREKVRVPGDSRGVPGSSSDAWRTDNSGRNGTEVLRYHGTRGRGRMTRAEEIDEMLRDLAFARDKVVDAIRSVRVLKDADLLELGPIRRKAAWDEAADPAAQAGRLIDAVVDKLTG